MNLSAFQIQVSHTGPVTFFYLPRQQEIDLADMISVLHPQEHSYYLSCNSKTRRDEFLRSRWLIKKALHQNQQFCTWPRSDAGIAWPFGIQASLSHKSGDILFAYTRESLNVGVDLEDSHRDLSHIKNKIMSELEMQHVSLVLGHRLSSLEISAVFSFKESVFKCLYPKVGQWFWFLDVEISTYDQQSMACQLKRDLGPYPKGTFVHGNRWIVAPNRLATCAIHPDVLSQK